MDIVAISPGERAIDFGHFPKSGKVADYRTYRRSESRYSSRQRSPAGAGTLRSGRSPRFIPCLANGAAVAAFAGARSSPAAISARRPPAGISCFSQMDQARSVWRTVRTYRFRHHHGFWLAARAWIRGRPNQSSQNSDRVFGHCRWSAHRVPHTNPRLPAERPGASRQ